MSRKELKDAISEEVAIILSSDFQIDVTETQTVPHSDDPAITFPNLDTRRQGAKLIDTCVLYIDIRRSTELNLTHKQQTVARLYSAFVRVMTQCARENKGHVRGIIGDRVMVLFDRENAFVNAVNCAMAMNSVAQYVINKHFTRGQVECGIGIDAGKMLATKTGIRRRGVNQHAYRSLVWLGRPANVASKLTDLANKPEESFDWPIINVAYRRTFLGIGSPPKWTWQYEWPSDFVRKLSIRGASNLIEHSNPTFEHMLVEERKLVTRPKTKPILITDTVFNGYKAAAPQADAITKGWFDPIDLQVSGYKGKVYSGDVVWTVFRDDL
jgi:adenylate cyclase